MTEVKRAVHTGEYWLTADPTGEVELWTESPTFSTEFRWWPIPGGPESVCILEGNPASDLKALADPEKPVRVRLTLTAELIDD